MKTILTLAVFALTVVGFSVLDAMLSQPIAIGPYVQEVTPTSAAIYWWTDTTNEVSCDGTPRYAFKYEQHQCVMSHLKPDTVFPYNIRGHDLPEGAGSVTTFPDEAAPFHFNVIGDTRTGNDIHAAIVALVQAETPLLVVNTGDLVSNGLNLADWETFFGINQELMRFVPYYPVLGNHENNAGEYFDFFHLPGNERYYSFTVGNTLFLMLDSQGPPILAQPGEKEQNEPAKATPYMETQKAWVETTLQANSAVPFVFAAFHKPMYSANSGRLLEAAATRAFWGDIFERYGVQVVLNGHDHYYHHARNGGTHYVVTGGGGAPLYNADAPQPQTLVTAKTYHYLSVDVDFGETILTAIDLDGSVIDTFTVEARATP